MFTKWTGFIRRVLLMLRHAKDSLNTLLIQGDDSGANCSDTFQGQPASGSFLRLPPRILRLKIGITAGLVSGLLLSPKLWLSSRFYPLTPVWSGLRQPPFPLDYALFVGCVVLIVMIGILPRPSKLIGLYGALAVALTLLDQSRLQPWFYEYTFMLITLGLALRKNSRFETRTAAVNTCRLIVASIYFWSGLQKLNSGFIHDIFPWMIEPVNRLVPTMAIPLITRLGIMAPFVEFGIGLALLSKRCRSIAVSVALAMHLFILIAIGPLGQNKNTVIWSWNMIMAFFVIILFYRASDFSVRDLIWPKHGAFQRVVLVLFSIAPLLSFFGLWDNYLSWALYAGNKSDASLYFTDSVYDKLPDDVQEYVTEERPGLNRLNISDWSYGELNTPPYPELRIYKNIARTVCRYAERPTEVTIAVRSRTVLFKQSRQTTCDCSGLEH